LNEGGIEVRFNSHFAGVKPHKRGEMPPCSHFVRELPRKFLKKFPTMLEFNKRRQFTGLTFFKPDAGKSNPKNHNRK
jgi:hypothetical protein